MQIADPTSNPLDGRPLLCDTRWQAPAPNQVARRRQTARQLGLRPTGRWKGREWTAEQLRLLGTMPDAELAEQIGRTPIAVRIRRERLGIAKFGR